jgi:NitT/TauT family transport system substrate-binding protein
MTRPLFIEKWRDILVHGSCHGGWCCRKLISLLRNDGHNVYTPTLNGLGERSHLVNRSIGLDTHILDIVQVLEYEDLNEVILVGHSYGGLVIGGVTEKSSSELDATYIGPNPAINGYVVSNGQADRVIAGATSGGASFVVRNDAGINSVQDLGGKKFASPQLGNTQDIALRKYLSDNGFNTVENGGNVTVLPIANADILTTFLKKEIDGAWVPEPWATRLVNEANGKILIDERDLWPPEGKFVTAHLIVSPKYLKQNPDVIKRLLAAHVNETQWINEHKDQVPKVFNTELKKLTGQTIPEDTLTEALTRLEFTNDPIRLSLFQSANDAYDLGFLAKGKDRPDLSGIYDLTLLDEVLSEKGLPTIGDAGGAGQPSLSTSNATNQTQGLTDVV